MTWWKSSSPPSPSPTADPRSWSPSARGPRKRPEVSQPTPLAGLPIEFRGSFPDPSVLLEPPLPEIAFVGRSNVGKSSLLNALVGRRALARVSSTPGKTQHLNVFQLPTFYLIDLPGYGWARASATERMGFRQLLETYLKRRESLAGIIWLLDIRHAPSADDFDVQEVLVATGRPTLVTLTKGDKLPRAQRAKAAMDRARDLGIGLDELLLTSSKTGEGMPELAESVLAAVAGFVRPT